jgi:hypothetical protein
MNLYAVTVRTTHVTFIYFVVYRFDGTLKCQKTERTFVFLFPACHTIFHEVHVHA